MTPPLLRLSGIDKRFPGVHALRKVSLDIDAGEVLALLGENGAGKSTLIKILAGAYQADDGRIELDGQPVRFTRPHDAQRVGISVIYQEFNLVPSLTVRENLFLGRETTRAGFVRRRHEEQLARQALERVGINVPPEAPCASLTIAQQQAVEIARSLLLKSRIVIMDEPSAALTGEEVRRLFDIVRELRSQGVTVIYVSHRLEEIFEVCDRMAVLRDGNLVATRGVKETSRRELIELMVGRSIETEYPKAPARAGDVLLSARNLCRGNRVRDVSFDVRRGEVLALAGLVGSGRTETVRLLFGADIPQSGSIELAGKPLRLRSPRDAIRAGICLLTEDRKSQGLILKHSVRENFGLPNLKRFSSLGFIHRSRESGAFRKHVEALSIRIPHDEVHAAVLSGGNQQKVVLAKWLEANSKVVIFDEPTRGIDVGAKVEVYHLINRLAAAGKAIVIVSSELPEALGMADRLLVMHEGKVKGEIRNPREAAQSDVLEMAVGA